MSVSVRSKDFVSAGFLITLSNKIGMIVNNTIEIRINCRNAREYQRGCQEHEHANWLDVRKGEWLLRFRRQRSECDLFQHPSILHKRAFSRGRSYQELPVIFVVSYS